MAEPAEQRSGTSRRAFLLAGGAVALGGAQAYWYLRNGPAGHLSAREFGAVGDGMADDGPALRRALAAAGAAGPGTTLTIEAGRYRVTGPRGGRFALPVSRARDVSIAGRGATIVVADPALGCLSLSHCSGYRVSGLTIDYDPPPYTETTINAVHSARGAFDVVTAPGYPTLDAPFFSFADTEERHPSAFGAVFDPSTRLLKIGVTDHVFLTAAERLGSGAFRLWTRDGVPPGLAAGDTFVYLARQNGHAVACHRSSGTNLTDVHVRAANAIAFALVQSDSARITGCTVAAGPGSSRLLSTNADAVHAQACRVGPTVEDCTFEGMLDDGLNVYVPPLDVLAVPADAEIVVGGDLPIRTGDRLEFTDPASGAIRGLRHVRVVEENTDGTVRIRLDAPLPGPAGPSSDGLTDAVFNLSASGEGYVVRNNRYRRHRGHAMRLHTGRGRVEGNEIDRTSREGITVSNDPDWPEGPNTRDLLLRGNTVVGTGGSAAIEVEGRKLGHQLADEPTQRGVRIEGNHLRNWRGSAIAIGAAHDIAVRDTTLVVDGSAEVTAAERGVLLDGVQDVRIDGLVVRATPAAALTAGVEIAPTVATGVDAVRVCDVRVPARTPPVLDRRTSDSGASTEAVLCSRRSRLEEAVELAGRVDGRLTGPPPRGSRDAARLA